MFTNFTINPHSQGPEEAVRAMLVQVKEGDSHREVWEHQVFIILPRAGKASKVYQERKQVSLQKSVAARG